MSNNKVAKIKKNVGSIIVNFRDKHVELYFRDFQNKFFTLSYYEYRIFKQIDGFRRINEFHDVDHKLALEFISFFEKEKIVEFVKDNRKKGRELEKFQSIIQSNDYFKQIIEDNFENKKILIIGCNNEAVELATQLAKLNVSKFVLWDYQIYEESEVGKTVMEYVKKSETMDSSWRIKRVQNAILNTNPIASIDIIDKDISTYDFINSKSWLLDNIDFAIVLSNFKNTPDLTSYDLLTEYGIPFVLLNYLDKIVSFSPIIQGNTSEAKELINNGIKKGRDIRYNPDSYKLNLKEATFLAQNLVHEIIMYFLDRQECQILTNKVLISLTSFDVAWKPALTSQSIHSKKSAKIKIKSAEVDEKIVDEQNDEDLINKILNDPKKMAKIKKFLDQIEDLKDEDYEEKETITEDGIKKKITQKTKKIII